jgi:hypothetical protein
MTVAREQRIVDHRPSAWLIAGCERLSRRLARVMLPSA